MPGWSSAFSTALESRRVWTRTPDIWLLIMWGTREWSHQLRRQAELRDEDRPGSLWRPGLRSTNPAVPAEGTRLARCVWGDMFYLCLSQCQSKFPWLARKKAHQLAQSFILSNFLTSLYRQCQPAGVQRVSAGWITKSINTLWKQEVWEMY